MQKNNQKFNQKSTKSHIYGSGETKVRKVMRTLYGFNRPMKVKEIMSDTGFTQKQVWKTLEFLSSVRMITKAYEDTGAKRRIPPKRNLIVSLSETQFKRAKRFLKK